MTRSSDSTPRIARLRSGLRGAAVLGVAFGIAAASAGAQEPQGAKTASPGAQDWVKASNENAHVLMEGFSRFNPEMAGQLGVDGIDESVMDLKPKVFERSRQSLVDGRAKLQERLATQEDPRIKQDLEILVKAAGDFIEESDVEHKLLVPYYNISEGVFSGIHALLDDQVEASRRPAALVRLRRYAGLEPGYESIVKLAEDRTRERLSKPGLLCPVRAEVEKDLGNSPRYIEGIEELFKKYEIAGYEPAFAKLKTDLAAYDEFVRKEILPKSRTDFRQPPELYALSLKRVGIDMPVEELTRRAEASFAGIRNEMRVIAPLVAQQKGWTLTDYRDVLRELKKEQLVGDAILPHYKQRIQDLEEIIRRERILTLPEREMRIRIASEAEAASVPAPSMRPPRFVGNTGEMGEFLLPLNVPSPDGKATQRFDDFTYSAASWTLTAHEGRPGHEMQFTANLERGLSLARSLFAFNNVNVEGWGLYAEAEMKPYMPLEGQLVCLQHRLMRAARAFLDPGLQMGTVTREEALQLLREEVVLSEAMANQEVERYTFRSPGQAPSYFCGYERLMEMRTMVERALGHDFDRQRYHDFVLSQGLLPPALLRQAVLTEFVPQEQAIAGRKRAAGN